MKPDQSDAEREVDKLTEAGVAIVGAREGSLWTSFLARNCNGWGYSGALWPVSRSRKEILGIPTVPSLDDLPGVPDAIVIATGPQQTIGLARTAIAMGVEHVIAIADGFAERGTSEGIALQEQLAQVAAGSRSKLYGPNGLGFADFRSGLCPLMVPLPLDLRVGNVSVISQSGSLLSSIIGGFVSDGVGADWCVSIGNGAAFHVIDALEYLVHRDSTSIICGYIESFGEASRLRVEHALEAAQTAGKKVILIKAGASERSADIALSHTASVAGSSAVIEELFRRHNVVRIDDAEQLVRTVSVMNYLGPHVRKEAGVAVLESSGGTAAMVADDLGIAGVRLSEFSAATLAALSSAAPSGAYVRNPVDLTAAPKPPGVVDEAYDCVYRDPAVGAVLLPWSLTFPDGNDGRESHEESLVKYGMLTQVTGTPTILATANLQRWTSWMRKFRQAHPEVLVVQGLQSTVKALASVFPAARSQAGNPISVESAGVLVGEAEGRQILGEIGLPLAAGTLWAPPYAEGIVMRFPCAVKAVGSGLAHRARLGAVVLGCRNESDIAAARDSILGNLADVGFPAEQIEGLLIEEMVFGPEILVGFRRDAWYGPYLALARGGVNVEEHRPIVLDLPPDDTGEALAKLELVGISSTTISDTVSFIAKLAYEFTSGRLIGYGTLELNPVVLTASGPKIADVLLIRQHD
jgi:acyl-CoA synthetase (NDP forming)